MDNEDQDRTEGNVLENETSLNLLNPKVNNILAREIEKDIEYRIKLALNKVQKEMKADIFGFGEAFHRKFPGRVGKCQGSMG